MSVVIKKTLKILLLQIRQETRVREEELASFAQFSDLDVGQFDVLNVFDNTDFEPNIVDDYDAVYVGGASEASVLEPDVYPFVTAAIRLLLYCLEKSKPVFASCFGFQLAVIALGGTIVRDLESYEMGTIPIQLTEAAKSDLLFNDVPDNFLAVSVHQEKTMQFPEGSTALAQTEHCCHAFKVINKPFWAFQFHPEVDKCVLVERLTIYKGKYTNDDSHLNAVLDDAQDTPESNFLLRKFVDRVLLG